MRLYLALAALPFCPLGAKEHYDLDRTFSIWGEYVQMRRSETNNTNLILDTTSQSRDTCGTCHPHTLCKTRQLVSKFDFEPGYRVGMEYMTHKTRWEATYLWLHEWQGKCSRSQQDALFFSENNPYYIYDFYNADHASADYISRFQNGELNFFRYATPPHRNFFSGCWMLGLRSAYLVEKLDINFTKEGSTSSYDIETKNLLDGLQIGGGLQWNPIRQLGWDLMVKGAGFYNWATQKTFLGDYGNSVVVRDYEAHSWSVPFLIDVALSLTYQPVAFFNLHAGYQFMYLNGVALAADQIVKHASSNRPVRTFGEAMIYGFYVGVTLSL